LSRTDDEDAEVSASRFSHRSEETQAPDWGAKEVCSRFANAEEVTMRLLDFEAQRGSDGRVRAGVWDRVCVPGNDEKDGMSSEFSLETLSQMVDNFVERGDLVPLDYNHQSQHAAQNGQPAPALAFYGALAVVWEGKLQKVGYARGLDAQTVGGDNLDVSRAGLWALRTEVTELGDQLLMNFRLLSPTFTTEGTKRDGTPIGYQLIAVAATNTPWQAATELTFEAPDLTGTASSAGATNAVSPAADKEKGMNPELLAKLGLAEGCSPEEMHAAFAKYMEDAESMKAKMAAPPPAEMDKADGDEDEKKMEKDDDKADDAKMGDYGGRVESYSGSPREVREARGGARGGREG
jgi:phage I-like protein